ncbi:MAG: site-2 protease family protein [Fidelibacterota bacterium]
MTEAEFREILRRVDDLFTVARMASTGQAWVAEGELTAGHTLEDLEKSLDELPVNVEITPVDDSIWLKVTRRSDSSAPLVIPTINLVLFALTLITTVLAGSFLQGGRPFVHAGDIVMGIPYSLALLSILGTHEFGHYFYARRHRVDTTLPYFLPAPPLILLIGTFGAFIRIRSRIRYRKALLEIGAAGPIAGFVVSVAVILLGFALIPNQQAVFDHIERVHRLMGLTNPSDEGLQLVMGTSLLFSFLSSLYNVSIPMDEIYHFPLIFAGWIGFLVTMLNLLPIGQLDGGHIAYALLGEKHNKMAKWVFLMLVPLGFISSHWWVWAVLIFLLMGSWKHPPITDLGSPITDREKRIGLVCLGILVTSFIPIPIQVL